MSEYLLDNGPACPCELQGEWVSTCEAHPVNPDARGCECPCHTREHKGIWKAAHTCTDCGNGHLIGKKHGPPQCEAVRVARHRCERAEGNETCAAGYHHGDRFTWTDTPPVDTGGVERLAQRLKSWAMETAARFNAPVYLVGSALTDAKPRDIDIRVVLSAEQYAARYGDRGWVERHILEVEPSDGMRRLMADMAKLGDWVSRYYSLNVDLQIQHEDEVRHFGHDAKRGVRLDDLAVPLPMEAP